MKISSTGVALLHYFEGCELSAYPDPATNGDPWTIGYGCTGPGIVRGLSITQSEADALFAKMLTSEFEPGVSSAFNLPITQGQFDACVCLAFNIGIGKFKASTLVRMFNAGNVAGAADQFLRWDKAAGQSMKGLRRRRAAERAVFNGLSSDQAFAVAKATV